MEQMLGQKPKPFGGYDRPDARRHERTDRAGTQSKDCSILLMQEYLCLVLLMFFSKVLGAAVV